MQNPVFEIHNRNPESPIVLLCDHASNYVPEWLNGGSLGLNAEDMDRHIAYDIGAAGLTRRVSDFLDASAILSGFSRLAIDANRGESDPTLIMRISDGLVVPANRSIGKGDRERRIALCHRPYHAAIETLLNDIINPVVVSIHSFTRRMQIGGDRPWHVGVLSSEDRRLANPLLAGFARQPGLVAGDNQPYAGRLQGDTIDRHAFRHGHPHALIEIRNDGIKTESGQAEWAQFLAPLLKRAVASATEGTG